MSAKRIAPDGTPRSAASHLRLFCFPMSHKRTPGLYGLKTFKTRLFDIDMQTQSSAIHVRAFKILKTTFCVNNKCSLSKQV